MIILGVDPGLTRCGVGVIEAGAYRRLSFIHVDVVRSAPDVSQDLRLLAIYNGLVEKMDRFVPDVVSRNRITTLYSVLRKRLDWLCSPLHSEASPWRCTLRPRRSLPSPATVVRRRFKWNVWSPVS